MASAICGMCLSRFSMRSNSDGSSSLSGELWPTLELLLFSFRIFSGFVCRLPRKLPDNGLIQSHRTQYHCRQYCRWFCRPFLHHFAFRRMNGFRYFQMFGVLLDDLAAALISVGLFVYMSSWLVK